MHRPSAVPAAAAVLTLSAHFAHAQCQPGWSEGFGRGPLTGINVIVRHDDGQGPPRLLMGGHAAPGRAAVQQWDGARWTPIGAGGPPHASAIASFNDGSDPALYAGGMDLWRLSGPAWEQITAPRMRDIAALHVYDDGAGPALYVGSRLDHAYRLRGGVWQRITLDTTPGFHGFAVFDDGSGPALYACGSFTVQGEGGRGGVARLDGLHFRLVGGGIHPTSSTNGVSIDALAVFDDDGPGPNPPALYAGGRFSEIGGEEIHNLARWNGQEWRPVGGGVNGRVRTLRVIDRADGAGPALYAGGDFTQAGGAPAPHAAVWNGQHWAPAGAGFSGPVSSFGVLDVGSGPEVYAGGGFSFSGDRRADAVAILNNDGWSPLSTSLGVAGAAIHAAAVWPSAGGDRLVIAGEFDAAGPTPASNIAVWDGSRWASLGSGLPAPVIALALADIGGGASLYAAGAATVSRWDGAVWHTLEGLASGDGTVRCLAMADLGDGPRLYAGGGFAQAGGSPAHGLAAWDGQAWTPIPGITQASIRALAVFDDNAGQGPRLFAAGAFRLPDGPHTLIGRWDGAQWTPVGGGLVADPHPFPVRSLLVFDEDGSGPLPPSLYAAGSFHTAGGAPARGVARWDGSQWSPLGAGLRGEVRSLLAGRMPGSGQERLMAFGAFRLTADGPTTCAASWDGAAWHALEPVWPQGFAAAAALYDDDGDGPGEPSLYIGGTFTSVGLSFPSARLARWGTSAPTLIEPIPSLLVREGSIARLRAHAAGTAPLEHQWWRNGLPLADGGPIAGADSPALSIRPVSPADAGVYELLITNPCGQTAATVALDVTCAADWNEDGAATSADIAAFITDWLWSIPSGSPRADFNRDGAVNSTDISAFISAWLHAVQNGC